MADAGIQQSLPNLDADPQRDRVLVDTAQASKNGTNRILDLGRIQTPSLKLLAPTPAEIAAPGKDRGRTLESYAERLRASYRENRDDFRAGLAMLSESISKGEQIAVACNCRNGKICHADVVKMAIEKVHAFRTRAVAETMSPEVVRGDNPRTLRAINEILAFSEHDRLLAGLNQTDGRNRSEQASFLGKTSEFARDVYERGAIVSGGNLIVPAERLESAAPLAITTQPFAVQKLARLLGDEAKAKELAPVVTGYAEQIAGATADGETKIKVFNWIYDSLAGKSELVETDSRTAPDFDRTLAGIAEIAAEMKALEPSEPFEISESTERDGGGASFETYERIELRAPVPQLPADWPENEIQRLLEETLPEIDRQLENGVPVREILKPFGEVIRRSGDESIVSRLSEIAKQNSERAPADVVRPTPSQVDRIDVTRPKVIELERPSQFYEASESARTAFYNSKKLEKAELLQRLDALAGAEERSEVARRLRLVEESRPSFGFRLAGSAEIVSGKASAESIEARRFVAEYVSYQLSKPESRLRFENERYRRYAAMLETAPDRDQLLKKSSAIRTENALDGIRRKDMTNAEKSKLPPALSAKELRILFTEPSPAHYDASMTAARLSFAHSGETRRSITESLHRGELRPSEEARSLVESLDSRRNRRDIKHAISATRHFIESLRTPPESLRVQNAFDHRENYRKLPPQEKDFVFQRATHQRENLEYRLAFAELEHERSKVSTARPTTSAVPPTAASARENFEQTLSLVESARAAALENEKFLGNYASKTTATLKQSNTQLPSEEIRQNLAAAAFGETQLSQQSTAPEKAFAETVKNQITLTDFRQFQQNREIIESAKAALRNESIPEKNGVSPKNQFQFSQSSDRMPEMASVEQLNNRSPELRDEQMIGIRNAIKLEIKTLFEHKLESDQSLRPTVVESVSNQLQQLNGGTQRVESVEANVAAGTVAEPTTSAMLNSTSQGRQEPRAEVWKDQEHLIRSR